LVFFLRPLQLPVLLFQKSKDSFGMLQKSQAFRRLITTKQTRNVQRWLLHFNQEKYNPEVQICVPLSLYRKDHQIELKYKSAKNHIKNGRIVKKRSKTHIFGRGLHSVQSLF
jgi:hypothetical protein